MDKYEIESKLYLTPTKGRLRLKTLLNLILVGLLFRASASESIIF